MKTALSESDPAEGLGQWSRAITPHRGWLDVRWRELWQYRDLIYLFVRRAEVGFGPELVNRYLDPALRERRLCHEADLAAAMDRLHSDQSTL